MSNLHLRSLLYKIRSSIAFYPALLSIVWIVIALTTLQFEDAKVILYIKENLSFLIMTDGDTARTLLSTFIGGLLSLTVFSFSMVMILLNQASASFSPRLLPGLITDKTNQLVLGVYIGTIIFCIIVLRHVQPASDNYELPVLSVLIAILSVLFCLVLFVYFIHNVSLKIRIEHILEGIFRQNHHLMADLRTKQQKSSITQQNSPEHIISYDNPSFGYFEGFDTGILKDHFELKQPLTVELLQPKGSFIIPNQQVIALSEAADPDTCKSLSEAIHLEETAYSMTNFENGFQQIVEIIVKAMSPGINDPGTAKDAIDTLTKLLAKRMELDDRWCEEHDSGRIRVIKNLKSFEDLIFEIMAPLRQYCKKDVAVIIKLVRMLHYLQRYNQKGNQVQSIVNKEFDVFMEDVTHSLESERDRQVVQKIRKQLASEQDS